MGSIIVVQVRNNRLDHAVGLHLNDACGGLGGHLALFLYNSFSVMHFPHVHLYFYFIHNIICICFMYMYRTLCI